MSRHRTIPLLLAAACYLLAVVQRPGTVYADTKINLLVNPRGFLGDVASAWSEQIGLGHVFGGQYGGYLFPMAPWFELGDNSGLPLWLVQRLWLGTALAFAAWGVVRLLDALLERPRGAPHVAGAVLFVLNPYVAVYANRTSISLLAYAALPWLLLAVHHGLRQPRSWRWPALLAVTLTCIGGGVNVAVTGYVLLAPALLVVYERCLGGVGAGALRPFLARLIPMVALANAWWLAPVIIHQRYGLNFLPFTEQPGTIWQTTSITESLRLTGFWTSYIGFGYGGRLGPFASHAPALLFHPPTLVASLVVPALALGGYAWTSRWRYGPWFLLLALTGLLLMVAGFPEGTPLRKGLTFAYNHITPLQFLRTTYKAGPLLALGLAGLGAGAFGVLWDRLPRRELRAVVAVAALGLVALAAWPLTSGRAPERQLAFQVPPWWHAAARQVDQMPAGQRAMVLPGRLFAYYDWGGTVDPVLPALARRPVAERMIVPFADLRAADLQIATDQLVSQERVLPGQLPPLLDLLGVGLLVSNADDDRSRSGAVGPVEASDQLQLGGLGDGRGLGPVRREPAAAGRLRASERLPRITTRAIHTSGMVRLVARRGGTIVDGGAEGLGQLAAFGLLRPQESLRYAADLDAAAIRRTAAEDGRIVVTDSNRRQAFVAARMRANRGPVLQASEEISEDGTMLNPFPEAGPDGETVAELDGIESMSAPTSPATTQFPEHRPYAALDADDQTAWLADRFLAPSRRYLDLRFSTPLTVATIGVLPYNDARGRTVELNVAGRRFRMHPGWNELRVDLRDAETLRLAITKVTRPRRISGGAGGIRELRIPGVRVRETLRPPVLAERALAGGRSAGSLTYLFSRSTVDAPLRTAAPVGSFQSALVRDRVDPERHLSRRISPPAAAAYSVEAWTSLDPNAADDVIDRMARTTGSVHATSSARFNGQTAYRASRAFDGRRDTAWVAPWLRATASGHRLPALRIGFDAPRTIRRLRLVAAAGVRRPTRVRIQGSELPVGAGGVVTLAQPVTTRSLRLVVTAAAFAPGTPGRVRQRRAVAVSEIEGIRDARVADGLGALRGRCGDASIVTAGGEVRLRPVGTIAALEADEPLRAQACGGPVRLAAGQQDITGGHGPLQVDHLALISRRPSPSGSPGRVLDPGSDGGRGERSGVRVAVDQPAWLVLGESYNRGWRASCDGRDLGPPIPMQGFANGWAVERGCRDAAFTWAPNRFLPPLYIISLLAGLAMLGVLLLRRRATGARILAAFPNADPPARWPLRRALAGGLVAMAVCSFVFAIRAGVVMGPALAAILYFGVPTRRLTLIAGGLLAVVVPVLYLLLHVRNPGGYNSNIASERIAAHWVGAAAVFLLLVALGRTLTAARRAR